MAEEQELQEGSPLPETDDGKISVEWLRKNTSVLDLCIEDFDDILACLKEIRPPSVVMRTKEYVKEWAEKNKIKGVIKMFGVEVDTR